MKKYDCLALYSGGLDSILAIKHVQSLGYSVLALHFLSPFFGHPDRIARWEKTYDIEILPVDVGEEYVRMLLAGPRWGVGKVLNPCVDCKILMLGRARQLMSRFEASFLITGEVLGQRPMSQRRDSLNIIQRDAGVKDVLVRPLCARRLAPTPLEEAGIVDREKLLSLSGRGRKGQLELAKKLGITDIPTPAGGCLLTEVESSKRYWPVFTHRKHPTANDFDLANVGRQLWKGTHWLAIGRNQADNDQLLRLVRDGDLVFRLADFPGPIGVGRQFEGVSWDQNISAGAAAVVASFAPKAVRAGGEVTVVQAAPGTEELTEFKVLPTQPDSLGWKEPEWETAEGEKREWFPGPQDSGPSTDTD